VIKFDLESKTIPDSEAPEAQNQEEKGHHSWEQQSLEWGLGGDDGQFPSLAKKCENKEKMRD
jgi:hypothetical protein